jgi:hypothetical protein
MPGALWELSEGDETVTIRTQAVRVALRRVSDRWIHEVGPAADGPPWLASVENPPDADDPSRVVSPVYQEVQHHSFDDDDRRVRLLLTGLLHKHHFSAVLTVEVDDAGATVVDFDVADRCRDAVSRLAATYEIGLGPGDLEGATEHAATWALGDASLAMTAVGTTGLATAAKGPRSMHVQALATISTGAFTHRLRYRWIWATRPDLTR